MPVQLCPGLGSAGLGSPAVGWAGVGASPGHSGSIPGVPCPPWLSCTHSGGCWGRGELLTSHCPPSWHQAARCLQAGVWWTWRLRWLQERGLLLARAPRSRGRAGAGLGAPGPCPRQPQLHCLVRESGRACSPRVSRGWLVSLPSGQQDDFPVF